MQTCVYFEKWQINWGSQFFFSFLDFPQHYTIHHYFPLLSCPVRTRKTGMPTLKDARKRGGILSQKVSLQGVRMTEHHFLIGWLIRLLSNAKFLAFSNVVFKSAQRQLLLLSVPKGLGYSTGWEKYGFSWDSERRRAGMFNMQCFPQKWIGHKAFSTDLQTSRTWRLSF